jgi:hypothetical protein
MDQSRPVLEFAVHADQGRFAERLNLPIQHVYNYWPDQFSKIGTQPIGDR